MAKTKITPDELRAVLRAFVADKGSQKQAAHALQISPAYLCDVLNGRRVSGKKILDGLSYVRVVAYRRIDGA